MIDPEDILGAEEDVRDARERLKRADDSRTLAEFNLVGAEETLVRYREEFEQQEKAKIAAAR